MLEYKMKVEFPGDRWFQVAVVLVDGVHKLEFKLNPNTLVVTVEERSKILAAAQTAIEAILRYQAV